MNIILIHPSEEVQGRVVLRDRRAKHIRRVLKGTPGDLLRTGVIDGPTGTSRIVAINDDEVVLETDHGGAPPPRPLTELVLALPRPIMLKRILSQAVSLGVARIFLINANRVEKSFFSASLLEEAVYREHLLHGLEQAVDTRLPEITVHPRFRPFVEDVLPGITKDVPVRLVAHPGGTAALPEVVPPPLREKTILAVGPEGGWVDFEIGKFAEQGLLPFSMGPRILRVDTAVCALLAQLDLLRRFPVPPGNP